MSTNTSISPKAFTMGYVFVIGVIILILAIAVTAGFAWIHADNMISETRFLIHGLDMVHLPVSSCLGGNV